MWDKLMGKVWSIWNIAPYRNKVITIVIIASSAAVFVRELLKIGEWNFINVIAVAASLTICIYFICYAIKHKDEWQGKYDDEPLIEVDLWQR